MAFAIKLSAGEAEVEACPYLTPQNRAKLLEMLAPPVKKVVIGVEPKALKIGGEEVLYRHEKRFNNPTAIAVALSDTLTPKKIKEVANQAVSFSVERVGQVLRVDALALIAEAGSPEKFAEAVKLASTLNMPLVLSSLNPAVMEAGLKACEGLKPLIHAATSDNYVQMVELAARFDCPLAVAGKSFDSAVEVINRVAEFGLENLVLDLTSENPRSTLSNLTLARGLAVKLNAKELGYPLMVFSPSYAGYEADESAVLEAAMVARYASLLVIPSADPWRLLPILTIRQNLFTDPQRPAQIKPGLYKAGEPDENSPVLATTNYALTFYSVLEDAKASGVPCWILVIDTEGLSVVTSIGGKKLTAYKFTEAIKSSGLDGKVSHKTLIIPGAAARFKGEVEEGSGWRVIVGPRESAGLPRFLRQYSGSANP